MSLLLALPSLAIAGPINWGYRVVDVSTGLTLSEQFGITETQLSFQAVTRPVAGFSLPNVTNSSRVTLFDELTGQQEELWLSYSVTQQWDLRGGGPNGEQYWDFTHEWEEATRFPGYPWRPTGGRSEYFIASESGSVYVEARSSVATPEPATFAIAGLGLLVAGLARWKSRRTRLATSVQAAVSL